VHPGATICNSSFYTVRPHVDISCSTAFLLSLLTSFAEQPGIRRDRRLTTWGSVPCWCMARTFSPTGGARSHISLIQSPTNLVHHHLLELMTCRFVGLELGSRRVWRTHTGSPPARHATRPGCGPAEQLVVRPLLVEQRHADPAAPPVRSLNGCRMSVIYSSTHLDSTISRCILTRRRSRLNRAGTGQDRQRLPRMRELRLNLMFRRRGADSTSPQRPSRAHRESGATTSSSQPAHVARPAPLRPHPLAP